MVRDGPSTRGPGKIVPTKLFVGNLPENCHRLELLEIFEKFGKVVECDIVKDYAFVHFEDVDEARAAVAGLHESDFKGTHTIRVEMSTSKVRQKPGMGGKGECYKCGGSGHWSRDCPSGPRDGGYGRGGGDRGGRGRGRHEPYGRPPPRDPYRDPYDDPYYRDRYPPPPPDRYRGYPDPYDRYPPPPDRRPPPPRDPYYRERDPYARPPPDYYARSRSPPPPRDPYAHPYYDKRPYDDYDYFSRYRQPAPPGVESKEPAARSYPPEHDPQRRPPPPTNYTDFTSDDIKGGFA